MKNGQPSVDILSFLWWCIIALLLFFNSILISSHISILINSFYFWSGQSERLMMSSCWTFTYCTSLLWDVDWRWLDQSPLSLRWCISSRWSLMMIVLIGWWLSGRMTAMRHDSVLVIDFTLVIGCRLLSYLLKVLVIRSCLVRWFPLPSVLKYLLQSIIFVLTTISVYLELLNLWLHFIWTRTHGAAHHKRLEMHFRPSLRTWNADYWVMIEISSIVVC